MLIARSGHLAQAADLVRDARAGQAGVLAFVGEAGVGKSALLDAVAAGSPGVTLLRVAGIAAEESLGYGALGVLLAPVRDSVDRLPPRLRRALRRAVGLEDGAADPVGVGTAVVELLGALSAVNTVVVMVDDVQWVDEDTRRVLGFVARRLAGQRVAVLLAARSAVDLPYEVGEPLTVAELSEAQAGELLRSRAADLDDGVAAVIAQRCGGNALVLVEVLAGLTAAQRRGLSALEEPAALPVRVAEAFQDRIDRLDQAARTALLVAVCEGRGRSRIIRALCGEEAVQDLLADGLLQQDGTLLRLRHPLLGTAVWNCATPQEQRGAHARLASAVQVDDPERAVWHRGWSVVGPDPVGAEALAEMGRRQRQQGAPLAAAAALERAAALAAEPRAQADLFAEAALMALDGGRAASAISLLQQARASGAESPLEPFVRGRLARLYGRPAVAVAMFARSAQVAPAGRRSEIRFEQLWSAVESQEHDLIAEAAAGLQADCILEPRALAAVRALAGYDVTRAGVPAEGLAALLAVTVDPLPAAAPVELVQLVAHAASRCGKHTLAESLQLRAHQLLSDRGDALGAANATNLAGFHAFLQGRWVTAEARCLQARQLVDEALAPGLMADIVHMQAGIAAVQGREETCRMLCRQLEVLGQRCEEPHLSVSADHHEALLEIGLQRWDRALPLLERAADTLARSGRWHPYRSPAVELVEVLLRLQQPEKARTAAEVFLSRTGPGTPPMGLARAAKMRALLAPSGEADGLFDESARLDGEVGMVFPQAQTWLWHAERLRREHRTVQAAALLTRALATFDRLEAAPWSARTKAELAACGRPQGRTVTTPVSTLLTAQELQIAVLVSEGLRNKEIGSALFLSLRTVEFHLSNVYRKLAISGRTQLANRMRSR